MISRPRWERRQLSRLRDERERLTRLHEELKDRGQEVIQVGESALDIFPKVKCLDEVLK